MARHPLRRALSYLLVAGACAALAPWLASVPWAGDFQLHTLQDTMAVMLALSVAVLALVRYYSRKSNGLLLLGAAFGGTAFLDGYHALASSTLLAERLAAPEIGSTSPWSWLASRVFLASFLLWNVPRKGPEAPLEARRVYLLVGGVTLACFAFFTFTPLPSAYFPELPLHRPAEMLPALLFLAALVRHLRRGTWRKEGLEHWLVLSLTLGLMAQVAFMPFAGWPFAAPSEVGHAVKSLSYLCVLVGLLGNVYSLFRQADQSAAELARINAELQAAVRQRTLIEQERERFFEMSLEMLCVANNEGYFVDVNPAWEKTLGYTAEELKSRPFVELLHPEDVPATQMERQRLRLGASTFDFENRYRAKDGTYRWLRWRSSASPERGFIYAIARDVEEEKRVEQMKNDFVSVVSHELRTPLTSIRGSLGLVAGGVAGPLPEKARTLVEIAAKNCERLVRLINEILDVEKIESGTMGFRMAALDLVSLVEQAVEGNRAYAEEYGVELRIVESPPEAPVWGDTDRLLQVMANLLSNAAKFSPQGGTVEIAVRREGGGIRVAVTDHGRGIPLEFQPRIFLKFAQADSSSTRAKGGTGLGLSITKAIVERHGGRVGFTSEPGRATTFFFELPEPARDWRGNTPPPPETLSGTEPRWS